MSKFKNVLATTMILSSLTLMIGCQSRETVDTTQQNEVNLNEITFESSQVEEKVDYSKETNPVVTMNVKDYGTVKIELYPDVAPNTVNNFIELVESGFYDGLTFHRVVNDFVIQGGDPLGNGTGDAGYNIEGEFIYNGYDNDLSHEEGVISMARSSDLNSASSQFFIMTETATHLDGGYAGFGKVIEGIDIVHEIEAVSVDENDAPLEPVVIESMTVDLKGIEYKTAEKIYNEYIQEDFN